MWSSRTAFENDACPVGDELLGSLYRASEHGLSELVESVSPDVRAMLACIDMRPHDARDGIAIGDPDPGKPELRRLRYKLFRMRRAAQEREIRGCGEFGVGHGGFGASS